MIFIQFLVNHAVIFQTIWFFCVTLIGATITQLLSFKLDTVGAIPFLKKMWPNRDDSWYSRWNCVILIVVGSFLAFVILEPDTLKASLCAGLTWCGTLQSIGLTLKTNEDD